MIMYEHLLLDITPPLLAAMKVCEQKFPVIQFSILLSPLIYHHKWQWTNGGAMSGFDLFSLCRDANMCIHLGMVQIAVDVEALLKPSPFPNKTFAGK